MEWLLRSVARRSCRVPVLVDAKTVLCAAAKGRSSSPGLLRILRRLAALVLAGDLLLRLVYVPSEDNPADAPSRGVVRRPRRPRRTCWHYREPRSAAVEAYLDFLEEALASDSD